MDPKNESVFMMQPLSPDEFIKQSSTRVSQTSDVEHGQVTVTRERGHLHQSFSPRKLQIIALGSNIGSGLFIGTGKALAYGGPGNMLLAYIIVSCGVWGNVQSLIEMTILYPTSGNFVDYAGRWVDPAVAFGAGFAEWLGWTAVFGAEAYFFCILVDLWAEGAIPQGALLSIFCVICLAIFALPNKAFAWVQYIGAMVKVLLFLILVPLCLALIAGAGPTGSVHDGSTWTSLPVMKNGIKGFANCALLAIWAVGDQVFIGVMGGEAEFPRWSLARSANMVPTRLSFMYILSVVFIGLLVPSDDHRLLSGSGVTASPFVIAVTDAAIPGLPSFINVCMIIGILAIALECIYLPSRILRTMSLQGFLPQFIANVDSRGRPRWALAITSAVALLCTYIGLSSTGNLVLNWLVSITSASFFTNWAVIALTSFRFHAAVKAQNLSLFGEQYTWTSTLWPLAPTVSLAVSLMLFACLLICAIIPVGGIITVSGFFSYTIGLLLIAVSTVGYKIIFKTKWVKPEQADLVTGRRQLSEEDMATLEQYYNSPLWKRVFSYVKP